MWVSSRYVSSDLGNLEHIMFFLWAFAYPSDKGMVSKIPSKYSGLQVFPLFT